MIHPGENTLSLCWSLFAYTCKLLFQIHSSWFCVVFLKLQADFYFIFFNAFICCLSIRNISCVCVFSNNKATSDPSRKFLLSCKDKLKQTEENRSSGKLLPPGLKASHHLFNKQGQGITLSSGWYLPLTDALKS